MIELWRRRLLLLHLNNKYDVGVWLILPKRRAARNLLPPTSFLFTCCCTWRYGIETVNVMTKKWSHRGRYYIFWVDRLRKSQTD